MAKSSAIVSRYQERVRFSLSASRLKASRNSLRILKDAVSFAITDTNVYTVYDNFQVIGLKYFSGPENKYEQNVARIVYVVYLYTHNANNNQLLPPLQHRNDLGSGAQRIGTVSMRLLLIDLNHKHFRAMKTTFKIGDIVTGRPGSTDENHAAKVTDLLYIHGFLNLSIEFFENGSKRTATLPEWRFINPQTQLFAI